MRVAVLSDVHGNLEALQATLAAISNTVDDIWSLGDVVGYGARPSACMALLRDRCSVKLSGNHDLVAAGATSPACRARPASRSRGRPNSSPARSATVADR